MDRIKIHQGSPDTPCSTVGELRELLEPFKDCCEITQLTAFYVSLPPNGGRLEFEVGSTQQRGVAMSKHDWPEDFDYENGYYFCHCMQCGVQFTGYKRRLQCKSCYLKTLEAKVERLEEVLRNALEDWQQHGCIYEEEVQAALNHEEE